MKTLILGALFAVVVATTGAVSGAAHAADYPAWAAEAFTSNT
jgi:hypothetical protein